jgi:dipeptidyl aminopeptidase/acylaminoacyl peptidase
MPHGMKQGQKVPLVVDVHGGPTWSYGHRYYLINGLAGQLFASHGFAVLLPNPRGSTGRGLEFAEANVGDMGGKDFQDVMSGVDYCLSSGMVDPERLYIMGGSFGGFITAWAVTQTDRFRAAIVQFGIVNWLSFHGTTVIPLWDSGHYRSDPFEHDGLHWKFSPVAHVKNVKTPTLIIAGEVDNGAPTTQGYEFFRALKDLGVETELVVYPREGHGLIEKVHVIDAMNRYLDWFKRHA